jgi:cytochrome c oxidase cbb3-type subunit 3
MSFRCRKSQRAFAELLGSAGCQPAVAGSLPATLVLGKLPSTTGQRPVLPRITRLVLMLVVVLVLESCKREERTLVSEAPPNVETQRSRYEVSVAKNGESARVKTWFDQNSWSMTQGAQLYQAFNCVGCHAHGGGGMGPPLMDEKWIYGSEPQQIYGSIVYGRPNGMPSFHGKIPDSQVWQIVAYVRSLSGLANPSAANPRDDHIKGPMPPSSIPATTK